MLDGGDARERSGYESAQRPRRRGRTASSAASAPPSPSTRKAGARDAPRPRSRAPGAAPWGSRAPAPGRWAASGERAQGRPGGGAQGRGGGRGGRVRSEPSPRDPLRPQCVAGGGAKLEPKMASANMFALLRARAARWCGAQRLARAGSRYSGCVNRRRGAHRQNWPCTNVHTCRPARAPEYAVRGRFLP